MAPENMSGSVYRGAYPAPGNVTATPYIREGGPDTANKSWAGPMLLVSEDTLRRALHAIEVAKTTVEATGSDQYSATFLQDDGKLGGKVVYNADGFAVDFDLFGQEARRPGGVG